jgi:hypothetical protein
MRKPIGLTVGWWAWPSRVKPYRVCFVAETPAMTTASRPREV